MSAMVCYKARFRPPDDSGYDVLRPPVNPDGATRHVIFEPVDRAGSREGWEVRPSAFPPSAARSGVRLARMHKCLPHRLFPEAEFTMWLDGVFQPLVSMSQLVEAFLSGGADLALHPHPSRDCLYREARKCVKSGKADPAEAGPQVARYSREGFPERFGLHATGVLLARAREPRVRAFMEDWWSEVERGTQRDQVSFDYCRWKHKVTVAHLPGWKQTSRLFQWRPHYHREEAAA